MTEEKKHPWLDTFWKNPVDATGTLLSGQIYMGTLSGASPPDILEGLARGLPESSRFTETLDEALREWLKIQLRQEPHLPAGLFARALVDAFSLAARIDMPLTREWLRSNLEEVRIWLHPFCQGKIKDPEGALLRTLALKQSDRSLLPLWYRLVDISEPLPLHYYSFGILGLRCMPDRQGEKQRDINPEVFVGILRLVLVLQKRPDGQNLWKKELQSLMAIYPRSERYWCDKFLPLLKDEYNDKGVYAWLVSEIPAIAKMKKQVGRRLKRTYRIGFRSPPTIEEMERLLRFLNKVSYEEFYEKVKDLRFQHEKFAQESGNSDIFVRFLCGLAGKIQSTYVELAEELLTEANRLAPYNPYPWTQLEKVYRQQGDFEKGELVGWKAYNRFPENIFVYTGLAEVLRAKGNVKDAEILYRNTVEKFPDNVPAYTGLAETLKTQGRYPESEKIYRCAMEVRKGDSNIYVRNGLSHILRLQERYHEAKVLLNETIKKFSPNACTFNISAEVWRAHGEFKKAEELYRESKQRFPQNSVAYVGLAVLLLRSNYEEAISLLQEVRDKFPNNKYAPVLLAKIKTERDDYAGAEEILEKAMAASILGYDEGHVSIHMAAPISEYDGMPEVKPLLLTEEDEGVVIPETKPEVTPGAKCVGIIPEAGPLPPDLSPIAVGFGSLYRHYGRWLQKKKREISKAEGFFGISSKWIDKALKQNPCNLYAIAERGWLLADRGDILAAFSHFERASHQYPHNASFHLGLTRMKVRQEAIKPDSSEWDKIGKKFPEFRQVFYLEQARYSLYSSNGYTSTNLSKLQKELILPQWVARSEKEAYEWFVKEVKSKLFHNVELKDRYTTTTTEQLRANNEEYGIELDGLAEAYVNRK